MESGWHYPRTGLRERIYRYFLKADGHRFTLFAERRKGKMHFLQYDLLPTAEHKGFTPVYVNFWLNKSDPAGVFYAALAATREDRKFWSKLIPAGLKGGIKAAAPGGVEATIEAECQRKSTQGASQDLAAIAAELGALVKSEKRVLLMLDEVQHLATREEFEDFTASLRTMLDTHGKSVYAVFTGSSCDGLNKMIRRHKAPFYASSEEWHFPELDDEFVDHILSTFADRSG